MGVYIKGMKVPKSCWGCDMPLGLLKCPVQTEEEAMCYCSCRHKDCPIVPVPQHGRLIAEADAVETTWMILRWLGYLKEENPKLEQTVREVFATAPAIEVKEHG